MCIIFWPQRLRTASKDISRIADIVKVIDTVDNANGLVPILQQSIHRNGLHIWGPLQGA